MPCPLLRQQIALCCAAAALLAIGCRNQASHVRQPRDSMSYPTPAGSPSMQGPSLQPSIPPLPPAPSAPPAPPAPQANHSRWGGQVVSEPVETQQKLMPYVEQPPRLIDRIGASFRAAFSRDDPQHASVERAVQADVVQAEVTTAVPVRSPRTAAPSLGIPEFQANVSQQFQTAIVESVPPGVDASQQRIVDPPAWGAVASEDVYEERELPLWPHHRNLQSERVASGQVGPDLR